MVIVQLPIQTLVVLLVNLWQQSRARIDMPMNIGRILRHVLVLVLLPGWYHYHICLLPSPTLAILVTKSSPATLGNLLHSETATDIRECRALVYEGPAITVMRSVSVTNRLQGVLWQIRPLLATAHCHTLPREHWPKSTAPTGSTLALCQAGIETTDRRAPTAEFQAPSTTGGAGNAGRGCAGGLCSGERL